MREFLLGFLYDTKIKALFINRIVSLICALSAFALLVYKLGFPVSDVLYEDIRTLIDVLFGLFAGTYCIRVVYSLKPLGYIKATWLEFIFMFAIIMTGFNRIFFNTPIIANLFTSLGFAKYGKLYTLVISSFLLYLVLLEFVKFSDLLNKVVLKPATTFVFSFILLICGGSFMLMLPEMTNSNEVCPYEAFFTSVSASCVTGLSIVDVSKFYSRKGQFIIMLLMQFGGIGIVSFTTFFATFLKKRVGFRHQLIIQDFLNSDSLFNAKSLLRQVIIITLFIEGLASVFVFFTWGDEVVFESIWHKLFYSVFHGVSAFCNAGFSLFSNSLYESPLKASYLLHLVIGVTIFLGSVGFSAIQDVFSLKNLRERMETPWVDWKLSTRISIYLSIALVGVGMFLFIVTEFYNVLRDKTAFEMLIISFFQSVTTRTAGFNSIDIGALSNATLFFMTLLMFVGASSGSTGGGIKTSTFLLVLISSWGTIKGRSQIDLGSRTISSELLKKASAIFVFAVVYNIVMVFILTISDFQMDLQDLVFEQVSAFSTTGLSTGITSELSVTGQVVLMVSMFVGRVGSLTLLLALSSSDNVCNYSYPKAHLFIG